MVIGAGTVSLTGCFGRIRLAPLPAQGTRLDFGKDLGPGSVVGAGTEAHHKEYTNRFSLERTTGLEPATSTLARSRSTN